MSRQGALFAALLAGSVLSTVTGRESGRAEDRREPNHLPMLQMSDPLPSGVLRLLERIGFRSLDRQGRPSATFVSTNQDASGPATASVSDLDAFVPETRAANPATPHDVVLSTDRTHPINSLREPRPITLNPFGAAVGPGQVPVNSLRAAESPAAFIPPTQAFSDGGTVAEPQVAAAADVWGTTERIPAFKIRSSSRRTAHLWMNKASVADGSDAGVRKAPNHTRDDTQASRENAIPDEPTASPPPGEPDPRHLTPDP